MEPMRNEGGMNAPSVSGAGRRSGVIINPSSDVLLPPEYFQTTTNPVMQHVEMSPSQFNSVINFDTLAGGSNPGQGMSTAAENKVLP